MTAEQLTPQTSNEEFEESSPLFDSLEQEYASNNAAETQSSNALEIEESLSPTADHLESALGRITGFLRGRAERKQKVSAQETAFDSYEENIQTTKDREKSERRDAAKAAVKRIGLVALGLGLMTGETAVRGTKNAATAAVEGGKLAGKTIKTNVEFTYAAAKNEASEAAIKAKDTVIDTWNSAEALAGRVGQKLENGVDTTVAKAKAGVENIKYVGYATKESIGYMKERYLKRKDTALTRKYERHARWSRIKNEAKAMAESYRGNRKKKIGRAALGSNLFNQ